MLTTTKLPEAIPIHKTLLVAFALLFLQLLTGTSIEFVLLIFVFVVLSGIAVNALGGLRYLNGFCVAMLALKVVIISQIAKVFYWQAADSNLEMPHVTAAVLVVGMIGVTAASFCVNKNGRERRKVFKP